MKEIIHFAAPSPNFKPALESKIKKDERDNRLNVGKGLNDYQVANSKQMSDYHQKRSKHLTLAAGSKEDVQYDVAFSRKYPFFRNHFVFLTRGQKRFSPTYYW